MPGRVSRLPQWFSACVTVLACSAGTTSGYVGSSDPEAHAGAAADSGGGAPSAEGGAPSASPEGGAFQEGGDSGSGGEHAVSSGGRRPIMGDAGASGHAGPAEAWPNPPSVPATWVGTAKDGNASLGIGFTLVDDGTGQLSGYEVLMDPSSNQPIRAGAVTGSCEGAHAHWSTEGGLVVEGTIAGTTFTGMATFAGAGSIRAVTATLSLSVEP